MVMRLYRYILEIGLEEQERLLLKKISEVSKNIEAFQDIYEACQGVLIEFPTGLPGDCTLIEEASKRMTVQSRAIMPKHPFEKDMLVYGWMDRTIEELFSKIDRTHLNQNELIILKNLQIGVHKRLVDNPNFKGKEPYYKRCYNEFVKAKVLWLDLLDKDFQSTIDFFEDEE
ncbi:hypothetical protein ACFVS2_25980 [Brevibacillus sp. NPDC058079]|uniref:hypothetical protein n=1 Tax=Brevibacillus sp. NPDC058079 TaxID=3346330 RepID=UPI0036EEB754